MKPKPISYYDDSHYDYKKYWETRGYENQAEKMVLKKLFHLIRQKDKIIDIGGGFGRLTPDYAPLFKSCLLIEPSEKLLKEAKKVCQKYKNVTLQKSFVEKLPVPDESLDVALMVRVAHHLTDLQAMIKEIKRILKPGGYFILEFANKIHFKNRLDALLHLNLDFFINHQSENLKTKPKTVPFYNYHPNQIKTLLLSNEFKIIKCLSVSNFRHSWLKKIFPLPLLLFFESCIQIINSKLSILNYHGPSIFVLACLAERESRRTRLSEAL